MTSRIIACLLWCALLGWAAGILGISSLTREALPEAAFLLSDKFAHFVAFTVGGWLAAATLRVSFPHLTVARAILIAIVLVAAFGAIDEIWQIFTPGRTGGDPYDWIADFLGSIAGALLTLLTHARLERLIARP